MNKNILLIEDDFRVREDIVELLTDEGFQVSINVDGKGVLQQVSESNFALVLCDISLPVKSGFEILTEIREHLNFPKIPPFIFLTARVDRPDVRHGMELGADDYITKPFTRAELLKAIETQTSKRDALLKDIHFVQVKGGSSFVVPDDEQKERLSYEGVIFIDDADSPGMVKLSDIILIKADDDYTIVTTTTATFVLRKTMKKWEEILPEEKFMRIHRSYIINTNHVLRFDHAQNYTYKLTMNNLEEPITVSQRYSRKLRGQLK
ncbi:MAG: hypothetical protein AMXMBFR48_27480 [Ignavibacteriales bacterium]